MKTSVVKKVITFIVKYVIPFVLGLLEGDTHTVQDFLF